MLLRGLEDPAPPATARPADGTRGGRRRHRRSIVLGSADQTHLRATLLLARRAERYGTARTPRPTTAGTVFLSTCSPVTRTRIRRRRRCLRRTLADRPRGLRGSPSTSMRALTWRPSDMRVRVTSRVADVADALRERQRLHQRGAALQRIDAGHRTAPSTVTRAPTNSFTSTETCGDWMYLAPSRRASSASKSATVCRPRPPSR